MSLAPFSLKDAPSLIETIFPVGRLSVEAYKERKAVAGQTLTALGSYWKGRKPLILCRAVTLGCLLPATENPAQDLEIFLRLMGMHDDSFGARWEGSASALVKLVGEVETQAAVELYREVRKKDGSTERIYSPHWRDEEGPERDARVAKALSVLPYKERVTAVLRPEQVPEGRLLTGVWPTVNRHLGTSARSIPELVEELGIARFGRRPKVADTFCGSGSIPFEAARIGCDTYASDLNPIGCMLTWGAFNIVGASHNERMAMAASQKAIAAAVEAEMVALGFEHDREGNRAKTYLYCLETRCPKTGWMVPMAPSWVIAPKHGVIARLVPDHAGKRYDIEIVTGASAAELEEAALGTTRQGRLVHPMNPDKSGVEIRTIRGDKPGGGNALRPWTIDDVAPRPGDIFQERLYCIQWMRAGTEDRHRPDLYFAAPTQADLAQEAAVRAHVEANLAGWQARGWVPDMPIEPGDETARLQRERGWTHWHHLFTPRALLTMALWGKQVRAAGSAVGALDVAKISENVARLAQWKPSQAGGGGGSVHVFANQALNVFNNHCTRGVRDQLAIQIDPADWSETGLGPASVHPHDARAIAEAQDIFVTDPPYADAVNYHEITEFFIAWLRTNPPPPFDHWTWDSQRARAVKGKDVNFRRAMVEAYAAMTAHMPDNGLQVVMFTHQDAGVWADLAGILWASGLRVTAAWNIVTETESALKEGNYVQGTVCLTLRKRSGDANARQMELEGEIEAEVKRELARLTALDDGWQANSGAEPLYTDGDLTLAAYAAALRVITRYRTIDRRDVGADVFRNLKKGEKTPLRILIDYAEDVANRELVPRGFDKAHWRDLPKASRFYVRMLDVEARGGARVADFQNFARSFALADYTRLMGSTAANKASLAGAADLKAKAIRDEELAAQPLFQLLFATWKVMQGGDPKAGLTALKTAQWADPAKGYWEHRQLLIALADYLAVKTKTTRPKESEAAALLAEAMKVDRL
jgi:putative DNA methylase